MDLVALLFFIKFVFVLNLPFGYWRTGVKKFSWQWFAAIHLPVVILFIVRKNIDVEYDNWYVLPIILITFFLGQKAGQKIKELYISYRNPIK